MKMVTKTCFSMIKEHRPVLPLSSTNNTTNAGSILSLINLIITVGTQFDKDMIGIKFGSWVLKLYLCKKFIHHIQVESLSHPISMLPWLKSLSSIFKQIPRVESQSAVFSNSRWLIMINALIIRSFLKEQTWWIGSEPRETPPPGCSPTSSTSPDDFQRDPLLHLPPPGNGKFEITGIKGSYPLGNVIKLWALSVPP